MSPAATHHPTPVVLDVDTGIDDALALLLVARSPELALLGVTTVAGNVEVPVAARNTLRTLEVAGAPEVPVAIGADRPLLEPAHDAMWIHGRDGLGDSDQPSPRGTPSDEHAVDQLLRLSHQHAGDLVVVALGPLTNLALALSRDPSLAARLRRIVLMGGSARVGGNRSTWAEANIASDPEAAAIVFAAPIPRTMVGLDVTQQVRLTDTDVATLADGGDVGRFAAQILPFYLDACERRSGERVASLHDPLAVAVALRPELVETRSLVVQIELRGAWTRGMTVVDLRASRADAPAGDGLERSDVALEVDAEAARGLILGRLASRPLA